MLSAKLTDEIVDLLAEAAVEIANLAGPGNVVCRRLREMQRRLAPVSVTVGELARRVDIGPGEMLDAVTAAGIEPLWLDGHRHHDYGALQAVLRLGYDDATGDVELDLSAEDAARLALQLGVEPSELTEDAPAVPAARSSVADSRGPRRFVPSDTQLPLFGAAYDCNWRAPRTGPSPAVPVARSSAYSAQALSASTAR
jgi:hypothetical protein